MRFSSLAGENRHYSWPFVSAEYFFSNVFSSLEEFFHIYMFHIYIFHIYFFHIYIYISYTLSWILKRNTLQIPQIFFCMKLSPPFLVPCPTNISALAVIWGKKINLIPVIPPWPQEEVNNLFFNYFEHTENFQDMYKELPCPLYPDISPHFYYVFKSFK